MARLPLEGIRVADFSWIINGPQIGCGSRRWAPRSSRSNRRSISISCGSIPPFMADRPLRREQQRRLPHAQLRQEIDQPQHQDAARQANSPTNSSSRATSCWSAIPAPLSRRLGLSYEELRSGQARHHHDLGLAAGQNRNRAGRLGRMGSDGLLRSSARSTRRAIRADAPRHTGGTWPDYAIATAVVFHALAALRHRNRTGEGQWLDASMGETVIGANARMVHGLFHERARPPAMGQPRRRDGAAQYLSVRGRRQVDSDRGRQ